MFPFHPPWATEGGREGQNCFLLGRGWFLGFRVRLLSGVLWWLAASSLLQLLKFQILLI